MIDATLAAMAEGLHTREGTKQAAGYARETLIFIIQKCLLLKNSCQLRNDKN